MGCGYIECGSCFHDAPCGNEKNPAGRWQRRFRTDSSLKHTKVPARLTRISAGRGDSDTQENGPNINTKTRVVQNPGTGTRSKKAEKNKQMGRSNLKHR